MRNITRMVAVCFSLFLAACSPSADANIPAISPGSYSAMTGTIVGDTYACFAEDLDTQTKTNLNRWIELSGKYIDRTMTAAEFLESEELNAAVGGPCGALPSGLPVVVKQLDGLDYLVAGPDGTTFVIKAEGFRRDE